MLIAVDDKERKRSNFEKRINAASAHLLSVWRGMQVSIALYIKLSAPKKFSSKIFTGRESPYILLIGEDKLYSY